MPATHHVGRVTGPGRAVAVYREAVDDVDGFPAGAGGEAMSEPRGAGGRVCFPGDPEDGPVGVLGSP